MIKPVPVLLGFFIITNIFLGACQQPNSEPGSLLEIGARPETSKPKKLKETASSPAPVHEAGFPQEQAVVSDIYANVVPSGQNIAFWHTYSPYYDEALNKIISDFNSSNPWGITVTAQNQGSPSDLYEKMLDSLNTADAPGLVTAYQDQAAIYNQVGGLVNIDGLLNNPEWDYPIPRNRISTRVFLIMTFFQPMIMPGLVSLFSAQWRYCITTRIGSRSWVIARPLPTRWNF